MGDPNAVSFLALDDRLRIRLIGWLMHSWSRGFARKVDPGWWTEAKYRLGQWLATDGLRARYFADRFRRGVEPGTVDPAFPR